MTKYGLRIIAASGILVSGANAIAHAENGDPIYAITGWLAQGLWYASGFASFPICILVLARGIR